MYDTPGFNTRLETRLFLEDVTLVSIYQTFLKTTANDSGSVIVPRESTHIDGARLSVTSPNPYIRRGRGLSDIQ